MNINLKRINIIKIKKNFCFFILLFFFFTYCNAQLNNTKKSKKYIKNILSGNTLNKTLNKNQIDFLKKQKQLLDNYHSQMKIKKQYKKTKLESIKNPFFIIKTNSIVLFVLKRGILAPNHTWWVANDVLFKDKNGVNFYRKIKKKIKSPFVPLNIVGKKIYLVMDINCIKELMDHSPYSFGVGKLKKRIFSTFMSGNVGISEGKEWKNRRNINEDVLYFGKVHKYADIYNHYMKLYLKHYSPKNFNDFLKMGKYVVEKIVFNTKVPEEVFQIFSEANCLRSIIFENYQIKPKIKNTYDNFLIKNIKNPQKNSLIELASKSIKYCPAEKTIYEHCFINEIKAQIPHWIFPILGLFHSVIPRLLLMIANHPNVLNKIKKEILSCSKIDAQNINNMKYLRYCILEMVRLNNAVVTSFRTLKKEYIFKNGYKFKQGTQFLVLNNPVLREKEFFVDSDKFIPQRWSIDGMEDSYYSIMFNQGPQKCPGKDLAIFLAKSFIVYFLLKCKFKFSSNNINTKYIEQMINPYHIKFRYSSH